SLPRGSHADNASMPPESAVPAPVGDAATARARNRRGARTVLAAFAAVVSVGVAVAPRTGTSPSRDMGSEPGVQAAARGDTTLVRLEGSESPLLRILAATNRFDERAQLIPAAMVVPRVQAAGSRHVQQVAIGSVWDRLAD